MKLLFMIGPGFEDSEFFVPYYRVLEEGMDADVAAPEPGTVAGKHGYEFEAGKAIGDLRAEDYDALVLPGGKGPEKVRLEDNAVAITQTMMTAGKPVGAICHGLQVLISAGALGGRRATTWWGIRDDVKVAGAEYVDEEVVVDENLVTSRWPPDLPAFCREFMKLLRS